jgi:hypothetical protein
LGGYLLMRKVVAVVDHDIKARYFFLDLSPELSVVDSKDSRMVRNCVS